MALLLLLCSREASFASASLHDYATYIPVNANDWMTVEWSTSTGLPDEYEFRLWCFERNAYSHQSTGIALTRTFQLPKAGHYVVQVRACMGKEETRTCSKWAQSTDLADGPRVKKEDETYYTRAWWIYQYLRAPGTPVITR